MSNAKTNTLEELKKMSMKDRTALAGQLNLELAHTIMDIRTGKEKQTHKKRALRKQIAHIHTLNTQEVRIEEKKRNQKEAAHPTNN